MPFLTIITRTYKRPKFLADCMASIAAQECRDFEHLLMVDEVGIGVVGTHKQFREKDWHEVTGEYVYFLDDDNVLTGPDIIQAIKEAAKDKPGIIIARTHICELGILPPRLGFPPQRGRIDLGNAIMRQDVFRLAVKQYGLRMDGDFDYIEAGVSIANSLVWLNRIIMRAQARNYGAPENG